MNPRLQEILRRWAQQEQAAQSGNASLPALLQTWPSAERTAQSGAGDASPLSPMGGGGEQAAQMSDKDMQFLVKQAPLGNGPIPHTEQSIRGLYGSSGITPAGAPLARPEKSHFDLKGLLGAVLQQQQQQNDEQQREPLQPGRITMPNFQGLIPMEAYTRRSPLAGLFG
jgi:hypothetical protein